MKKFINSVLSRIGVVSVLQNETVCSYLNLYRVAFCTTKGEFCYLEIFYNDSLIFSNRNNNLIGEGSELTESECVKRHIKFFNSSKELLEHYEKRRVSKQDLDVYFTGYADNIVDSIVSMQIPRTYIKEVKVYTSPCLMIIVHYNVNRIRRKPLKLFLDEPIILHEDDCEELKQLKKNIINLLGGNSFEYL